MDAQVTKRDLHLSTPEAFDAAYAEAISLVHAHRAASVPLVQRHLRIGYDAAWRLLARMARETTFVRPMLSGLYIYAPEPLANELKSLHGFISEVLARSAQGSLDPDTIRALGDKHALQDYLHANGNQEHPA
ncbi:DNA translocase FtsK [Cupriavidus taiwanensis]|uniref:DNA translocase FtsK n=1 Tax=Cupriavidus taiwanensis TaxID=164546 RepID=UPI002540FB68|nr:DNA translocase FtsK [Cupriavidus taiwanensis]MDK3022913.1 DNA translocase FtsK [Cupriavidus taiwanensis]